MFIKIQKVPSRFKPYPENTEISLRELTQGEVLNFSEYADRTLDCVSYVGEREILKGIDIWDLTVGDWQFLQLQLVSMSYASPSYSLKGPVCDKCKKKNDFITPLKIEGYKPENFPPGLRAKLVPSDIRFEEVDEKAQFPVEVTLDSGKKVSYDFYRLKHYKELAEQGLKNTRASEIQVITGLNFEEEVSSFDYDVLKKVYEMLDHGIGKKITLKCPDCEGTKEVEVNWDIMSLFPHFRDEKSLNDRITLGRIHKPEHKGSERTTVQGRGSTLRDLE